MPEHYDAMERRLKAKIAALETERIAIMGMWAIESDESLTECVKRNIDGWAQRYLKAESNRVALEAELAAERKARNSLEGDRIELQAKAGHLEQTLANEQQNWICLSEQHDAAQASMKALGEFGLIYPNIAQLIQGFQTDPAWNQGWDKETASSLTFWSIKHRPTIEAAMEAIK